MSGTSKNSAQHTKVKQLHLINTQNIHELHAHSSWSPRYIKCTGIWWCEPGPEPYSATWCIKISSRVLQTTGTAQIYWSKKAIVCQQVNTAPNPLAKEELNLLAKLMGGLEVQKPGNADSGFRVNLFATDEEEEWVPLFDCVLSVCYLAFDRIKLLLSLCEKILNLFWLLKTNIVTLLYHREAFISRPDELSYGVIKIQATQVSLVICPHKLFFSVRKSWMSSFCVMKI